MSYMVLLVDRRLELNLIKKLTSLKGADVPTVPRSTVMLSIINEGDYLTTKKKDAVSETVVDWTKSSMLDCHGAEGANCL